MMLLTPMLVSANCPTRLLWEGFICLDGVYATPKPIFRLTSQLAMKFSIRTMPNLIVMHWLCKLLRPVVAGNDTPK